LRTHRLQVARTKKPKPSLDGIGFFIPRFMCSASGLRYVATDPGQAAHAAGTQQTLC
jgi:hypothetical protein